MDHRISCLVMWALRALFGALICQIAADADPNGFQRGKRLVHGIPASYEPSLPALHRASYEASSYSVIIMPGHGALMNLELWYGKTSSNREKPFYRLIPPVYTFNPTTKCMGVWLARNIVQTACHCLTGVVSYDHKNSRAHRIKHVWEDHMMVMTPVATYAVYPPNWNFTFLTQHFYIHQKCSYYLKGIWTHDYGIIVTTLRPDQSADVWTHPEIRPAPLYLSRDLDTIWTRTMAHQTVCLFQGWGWTSYADGIFDYVHPKQQNKGHDGVPFYGWRAIASYPWCRDYVESRFAAETINLTALIENAPSDEPRGRYDQVATWTCSIPVGKSRGIPTFGDSGGPVTCRNVYFAVLSTSNVPHTQDEYVAYQGPLAYSKFENAVEYRKSFKAELYRHIRDHKTWKFQSRRRFARNSKQNAFITSTSSKLKVAITLIFTTVCQVFRRGF